MIRNVLGSLLALAGAAAAVLSPFRTWYAGRHGSGYRVDDLFRGVGVTTRDAAVLGSLFLPMGFAALLTLLGVLLRSRVVVALAGVLVLGVTVLWMVRQAQFSHVLAVGGGGLGRGVADALLGGVLLLMGSALVAEPRPRPADEPPADAASAEGPSADSAQADTAPAEGPPTGEASAEPAPDGPPARSAPEPPGPPPYPPETSGLPQLPGLPELPELRALPRFSELAELAALDEAGESNELDGIDDLDGINGRDGREELAALPESAEHRDCPEPPDVPARQPLPEDSPPGM